MPRVVQDNKVLEAMLASLVSRASQVSLVNREIQETLVRLVHQEFEAL